MVYDNTENVDNVNKLHFVHNGLFTNEVRGCSQIMSAAEGGGGVGYADNG